MHLTQIVYSSRSRTSAAERAQLDLLRSILSVSRHNNARDDITGFLLLDRPWFFQVLEGERGLVLQTFERIQHDRRHTDLSLMASRHVSGRSFARWSMGGVMRNLDQREICLRHGIAERIDPNRITAPKVVALAVDLQGYEITRQGDLRQAS